MKTDDQDQVFSDTKYIKMMAIQDADNDDLYNLLIAVEGIEGEFPMVDGPDWMQFSLEEAKQYISEFETTMKSEVEKNITKLVKNMMNARS